MADRVLLVEDFYLEDDRDYGPLDFELRHGEGALILVHDLHLMRRVMACFLGEAQASSGNIQWWSGASSPFGGHSLWDAYEFFSQIGYVDRNSQLLPEMSLLDNLMLPHRYFQLSGGREIYQEILEAFDLLQEENTPADDLTEPQRRLALYALALSQKPRLMLMERPFQFLDNDFDRVWDFILRRASFQGLAYVVFDRSLALYSNEKFKVRANFSSVIPDSW